MQRQQLEHLIRAAAGITGATEIVVIGSQAVLGQFPNAPDDDLASTRQLTNEFDRKDWKW